MKYVIDSSLALSWCFPDEFNEAAKAAYKLAEHSILVVSSLWHIGIGNVLGMVFRSARIDTALLNRALNILGPLNVQTADMRDSGDVALILKSMSITGLTAYDSPYVELARQLDLPLGTLDRQMARAARVAGISLIAESVN